MAAQSAGVQQLLVAEKKAAEIVAEAKRSKIEYSYSYEAGLTSLRMTLTDKTKRLKQAKDEAVSEIDKFKKDREKQFQQYQNEHMGSKDEFEAHIYKETKYKLQELQEQVITNKEQAISRMLELVCEIKPELPKNFKP
jgi:V-type H+-transporting ATPase subunit G